ncbi:hypothetical protein BGX21_002018 [Mortierella sp. AD011]|nr:hypothetical protein BGX20_001883 [Mortierella sp. AD010]KAF9381712.1 hypothetical protein BGX21_002018 [Mortierella sp. AD011]
MSNNMTDRLSNTYNSTMGGAKQTVGEAIGNESLAASGSEQKARAEAAQAAADARTHAEGAAHKIGGKVEQTVGSLTGDQSMQSHGRANEIKGDIEHNV